MNNKEKLTQIADLAGCPEQTILKIYDDFLSKRSAKEAYKICCILLKVYSKHYHNAMNRLREMGVIKTVSFDDLTQ